MVSYLPANLLEKNGVHCIWLFGRMRGPVVPAIFLSGLIFAIP
jgi:hypothetical protein